MLSQQFDDVAVLACVVCDKDDAVCYIGVVTLSQTQFGFGDGCGVGVYIITAVLCRLLRFDACSPVSMRRSKQQSSVCGHLMQLLFICGKFRYRFKTDSGVLRDGVDARL